MGGLRSADELDVRDMVCAQALAQVARAVSSLSRGASLRVVYNTDDVRRDLVVWARDRHYAALPDGEDAVRLMKAAAA